MRLFILLISLIIPGCATAVDIGTPDPTPNASTHYSPPSASGLVAVRPYPTASDVCQVIGESDLTVDYLDHTKTLVGCPSDETGAIADRQSEGGQIVDRVGDWTLLSIPN